MLCRPLFLVTAGNQKEDVIACYLKRSTAGWYLVSDDSVVSLATLCENDGCVLFYTRTGTPGAGRDC